VAAACSFGTPGTSVEPVGENRYPVTQTSSGDSAVVEVTQPLGPGTIGVVTSASSYPRAATSSAATCDADTMLPTVRQALEPGAEIAIVAVGVRECQHGYARVTAKPDNSSCGEPGGSCLDDEQVFLAATRTGWTYLTSGTGISRGTDPDLGPDLLTACVELGLRDQT
jgi:hypothetical protein